MLWPPKNGGRVGRSAVAVAFTSALFCLSTALAYILASWEVSNIAYELAYRST
ncbi:MAG: hypothetical protein R6X08_01835 [Desulfosalsimonadaceae bacterium]